EVPLKQLLADCRYQTVALKGMVESYGGQLRHVKPHGALYNDMAKNKELSLAIIQLIKDIDPLLKIMGLAHSATIDACHQLGMTPISEGFADRRYAARDQLRSRHNEDAVLHVRADIEHQVKYFLQGKTILANGEAVAIQVQSLCVHSDTPGAVALSRHIHQFLTQHGIRIQAV
ncbi:MAG: LamB/YcsF family protein, partial [Bacteroidota bacterium]